MGGLGGEWGWNTDLRVVRVQVRSEGGLEGDDKGIILSEDMTTGAIPFSLNTLESREGSGREGDDIQRKGMTYRGGGDTKGGGIQGGVGDIRREVM